MAIKSGSISHAATALGLAQTALSIQIRDLEKEVGVKLLARHARGVEPTAAGHILFERFEELERFLDRTLMDVRAAGGITHRGLVIGLNPSIMRLVGADMLIDATTSMPGVTLRLVENLSFELVEALERGTIDLAFGYDIKDQTGLVREPVIEDELLYVTAPAFSRGNEPISFAEALSEQLFFAGDKGIVALVRSTAERLSLDVRIVADIQSVSAIGARIANGGASLLPYGTAADGVRRGVFALRRVEQPILTRTLYMIRKSSSVSPLDDPDMHRFLRDAVRRMHEASAPYSRIINPLFDGKT